MSSSRSESRFVRFMAGPIGLAIVLGLLVGFNSVFSRTSLADQIAAWVSWGLIGILIVVAGGIGLVVAGLLLIIPLYWLWFFLKELWESRLVKSRDTVGLREALSGDHPATRRAAVRALSAKTRTGEVAVLEIAGYLSDSDETVAVAAAESLIKLKTRGRDAVPVILQSLENDKHRSLAFRSAALRSIKKMGISTGERRRLKALKGKINRWDDGFHIGVLNQILALSPDDRPAKNS